MRSANAPVINAGVMMANINWKRKNTANGMVGAYVALGSMPTPLRNAYWKLPITPFTSVPNARLNPQTNQISATTPMAMKLCIMMVSMFFLRTKPP